MIQPNKPPHPARAAIFSWQSGIDGRESTPTELFNPLS